MHSQPSNQLLAEFMEYLTKQYKIQNNQNIIGGEFQFLFFCDLRQCRQPQKVKLNRLHLFG